MTEREGLAGSERAPREAPAGEAGLTGHPVGPGEPAAQNTASAQPPDAAGLLVPVGGQRGSLLTPPSQGSAAVPFAQAVAAAAADLPTSLPERPSDLMFALDIDGTLMSPTGVSSRVQQAIAAAESVGAQVVIATGRGVYSTRPVAAQLGLHRGWSVCSNGAVSVEWNPELADSFRIADWKHLDPWPAVRRLLAAEPRLLFGVDNGPRGMVVAQPFPDGELMRQEVVRGLDELLALPAAKLVARAPWLTREELWELFQTVDLSDYEYAIGWTSWADIGPAGVTKASGLAETAARVGVETAGVVAIGDGMNDIPMLEWAGHGVAMGDAAPGVADAADAVTASVDSDGAAAVIQAVLAQY